MTWDGKVRVTLDLSFDLEFSDFGPFEADSAERAEAIARFHIAEYVGGHLMNLTDSIKTEILEE